jgi:hypothetical protein
MSECGPRSKQGARTGSRRKPSASSTAPELRHSRPVVRNGLCARLTLCQAARVQAGSRISRTAQWRVIRIPRARSLVH